MKLNRRRLLKASLAAGTLAATQSSWAKATNTSDRLQNFQPDQRVCHGLDLRLDLTDLKTSKLLMQCCMLALSQAVFQSQKPVALAVDRALIQPPEISAKSFDSYAQIASFQAQVSHFYEPQFHGVALKTSDRAAVYGKLQNFGLALRSPHHNIIVLHATQSDAEWLQYASAHQNYFNPHQPEQGKVHSRIKQLYAQLKSQIQTAIQQMNPALPCYVTGYSLGGAIAHLTAVEIALSYPQLREKIQVHSFGAPPFGDRPFAKFYDALLPQTYRIVNLADQVPMLLSQPTYQHVGQSRTYVEQRESLDLSHAIETYGAAIGIS